MKVTLDGAELLLLLSALRLDPAAFALADSIDSSAFLSADGADVPGRIAAARRSVIERELASLQPGRGLVPSAPVAKLLRRTADAAAGAAVCFDVQSVDANDDGPGAHMRMSICDQTHSIVVHQRLSGGVHALASERYAPEWVADFIIDTCGLAGTAYAAVDASVALNGAQTAALSTLPALSERALLIVFADAPLADEALRLLARAACHCARHGGVDGLSQFRWLTDGITLWTVDNERVLRGVDLAGLRAQLRALVTRQRVA